jgi:hypothetical protein
VSDERNPGGGKPELPLKREPQTPIPLPEPGDYLEKSLPDPNRYRAELTRPDSKVDKRR